MSDIIIKRFSIELLRPYSDPSKDNPYIAKLEIAHDKNTLFVKVDDDLANQILTQCKEPISKAVMDQLNQFQEQVSLIPKEDTNQIENLEDDIQF